MTLAPARRRRLQHPLHQPQARRDPRALHRGTVLRGGKVTGVVRSAPGDQRQPVAPDDRRRAAAARSTATRRVAARSCCESTACRWPRKTRSASTWTTSPSSARRRDRRHRRRLGQRPAGAAGRAVGRGPRAPRAAIRICRHGMPARLTPRGAPRARPALRARGAARAAARCRRCRWPRTRCSRAPAGIGGGGLDPHRARAALAPSAASRRFNVKAGGPSARRAEPLGRQPAEVHRRPRDRRATRSC